MRYETLRRAGVLLALAALPVGVMLSCSSGPDSPAPRGLFENGAPELEEMFNTHKALTVTSDSLRGSAEGAGGLVFSQADFEAYIIEAIGASERRIQAAFEHLESEAVAQALVDAQARGVVVEVVGDVDNTEQAGFRLLLGPNGLQRNSADDEGPVVLGNGELAYNPQLIELITRPSEQNRMTHNFMVIDDLRVINLSGGFMAGGEVMVQTGFDSKSEDLGKDFGDEHIQMYGGMFSTTLSPFNGPLKSNTNSRIHYPHNDGDLEVYFGPQERLVKRVIDEIYNARASVTIVAEELTNEFIAEALTYKAAHGFEVRVVVNEANAEVPFSRVDDLRQTFDSLRTGGDSPQLVLAPNIATNIVIIDSEPSPISVVRGRRFRTRVMALSEPLLESVAFAQGNTSVPRASDAFADANMWVYNRMPGRDDVNVERYVKLAAAIFAQGN